MVLALKVVTPTGVVETPVQVRPCGIDLNGVLVGSEGCFGIITEATVKIEPIPEAKLYEGWFFPSFEAGFRAFYEVTRKQIRPTAMRLYDEDETRMSLAMRTDTGVLQHYVGAAVKAYLQHVKEMDLQNMALCIMGYEGTKEDVAHVKKQIGAIFARYGGFCAGKGVGLNWQEKKYDLPLVRDFALAHGLWADVFETCTVYSDALALWSSVKKAVREVWKAEGKTGWIGCHTAHQYRSGCCLYFTFAGVQHDDNDIETLLKIKRAATAQMLKYKGNLTHHHGIGYEHVPWMSKMFAPGALDLMLALKQQVDPQDICNPWKLLPLARKPKETEEQLAERRSKMQLFDRMGVPRMSKL
jgi:alkyldihydroxyacetonephosphate synthase